MSDRSNDPDDFRTSVELLNQSIGMLYQSNQELSQVIKELRSEMVDTYVRKDVYGPQLVEIKDDIQRHDDWLVWAQRLVLGAVLLSLVGLLLAENGVI